VVQFDYCLLKNFLVNECLRGTRDRASTRSATTAAALSVPSTRIERITREENPFSLSAVFREGLHQSSTVANACNPPWAGRQSS
jgi:hypothetical protein